MNKILSGIIILLASFSTMADEGRPDNNWVAAINYTDFSIPKAGLNFRGAGMSIAYKFNMLDNFYLIPELKYGVGVKDDKTTFRFRFPTGTVKSDLATNLDKFLEISLRGQYEFNSGIYVFLAPAYSEAQVTGKLAVPTSRNTSIPSKSPEYFDGFSLKYGTGYNFGKTISAELSLNKFDGVEMLSAGLKYKF